MWRYWAFGLLALAGVTYAQDTECEEMVPIGPATGSLTRWTYDKSQNQCKAFITKETLTGRNIFLTEKECMSRCLVNYDQLFPPGDAVCELPMDSGPCLALVPMWYYNKEKDVCESFFWGGCQGNGNKFEIKDSCNSLCVTPKKGKSGANSNTSNESSESQSDAGLIIGVVFGVVFGVAFLVTLAMYLVQRKKMKKQQHKRVPDTEMK